MKNESRYLVIYWVSYYILISLIESGPQQAYYDAFAANLVSLPVKIIFVVVVTDFLAPRLLFKKHTPLFLILYFSLLIVFAILIRIADNYIILEFILTHWNKLPLLDPPPFLYSVIKLQFALAIPLAMKLFLNWMATEYRNTEISNQKTLTELNFLRSQFHPHFMFNALNSLYSKILTRSNESADMVLKISSLLRFSLYEATGAVPLAREIQYLEDYMDLQKVRFEDKVDISFVIDGEPGNMTIEPFLILPLIENSFKFCQGNESDPAWVSIRISIQENWLRVTIENSKGMATGVKERTHSGGIGQANVRKRLELLYTGNYEFKIVDDNDHYLVTLKLRLAR